VYEVIGIEADWYRVLNDAGAPTLFPPDLFRVVDARRPRHWTSKRADGVEYVYAPELGRPGFFEDYFEGEAGAVKAFHRYINRYLRLTDAA
jgi:hypothetical protein